MSQVINATDENFDELTKEGLVFVDFMADWCGPCKTMSPVLDDLAKELDGKVTVVKVNVDNASEAAAAHGVRGVPTLKLLRDGETLTAVVGARPLNSLLQTIDEYL